MGTPGSLGMNNGRTTNRTKAPTFERTGYRSTANPSADADRPRTPESPFEHTRPLYFRQPYITEVETKGRGKGGRYPVTSADLVTPLPAYLEPTGQGARIIRVHKKGPGEFCRSIKRTTAGRVFRRGKKGMTPSGTPRHGTRARRVDHFLNSTRGRVCAYLIQ